MTQVAKSLAQNLENDGHKVYRVQLGRGIQGLFPIPKLYFQYIKVFLRCEIVHIISASGNSLIFKDLPAIILSRILQKKVVLNFVGGSAIENYPKWSWLKKLPFKWSNIVVPPSNILKNVLKKNEPSLQIVKIPHVVDIEYFSLTNQLQNDIPILLAAKSLESYSGYDILLDIFYEIKRKINNAEFWIAGDGPYRKRILSKVNKMGLNGVRFLGNISHGEMPDVMKKATVFVHGTKYESFGIALVEAMASSLPIVSFKVGGIPEVVINNKTGYLIPYGNKTKFVDAVLVLLQNTEKREKLGENSKQHSQSFSWSVVKKYWYKLYSELLL